jgi:hypothetical protein
MPLTVRFGLAIRGHRQKDINPRPESRRTCNFNGSAQFPSDALDRPKP